MQYHDIVIAYELQLFSYYLLGGQMDLNCFCVVITFTITIVTAKMKTTISQGTRSMMFFVCNPEGEKSP